MKKKILVVAAHPDDEILGCAGTVARLIKEGCQAYVLILGEGVTARDSKRNLKTRKREFNALKKQAQEANKVVGVKEVFFFGLADNRFDSVSLLSVVKIIEKVKRQVRPDIIFTHYQNDLNIDHRITYSASITAARPLPRETVREIYSFEVPSATEWAYPLTFSPNTFFDISETIGFKIKALAKYKNELRQYPHPRSLRGVRLTADFWGVRSGLGCAEAFKAVRVMK